MKKSLLVASCLGSFIGSILIGWSSLTPNKENFLTADYAKQLHTTGLPLLGSIGDGQNYVRKGEFRTVQLPEEDRQHVLRVLKGEKNLFGIVGNERVLYAGRLGNGLPIFFLVKQVNEMGIMDPTPFSPSDDKIRALAISLDLTAHIRQ